MNEEKQINKEKQIKKVTYEIIDSKRSLQMKKYKKLGYLVMT
jgi:hypothetical protein